LPGVETTLNYCTSDKIQTINPNLKKNAIISTLIAKLIPPAENTGK
jgi:hypothetical protein